MKALNPNAHFDIGEMPEDLQLDLLVDGELPEENRRQLLLAINSQSADPRWRELALRFLQRQTEKETVRALMGGGPCTPVIKKNEPAAPIAGRIGTAGTMRMIGIAAGLLIATVSAMITFYVMKPSPTGLPQNGFNSSLATGTEFQTSIPGEAVSFNQNVPVSVPVVSLPDGPPAFFGPQDAADPRTSKRSWIIQRSDTHAVVIPVNTLKAAVY